MKDVFNKFKHHINDREDIKYMNPENGFVRLCSLLPYRVYDKLDKLYLNEQGYGFILEATPMCGASQEVVDVLSGMFTEGMPNGCSIQIYNWASPKVAHIFDKFTVSREGGIYSKLAEKRTEFFRKANWESISHNPYLIREFRVFIAVSINDKGKHSSEEVLTGFRKQLITTLKNVGMESVEMEPNAFLSLIEEWLAPSLDNRRPDIKWDEFQTLNEQLIVPNRDVEVTPDGIIINNDRESFEVRSYSARNFPDYWAQWNNVDLIGDMFSDYARLACPFLSVLTLCYGNDEIGKDYAQFKLVRSSQANSSGLGRFVPQLAEKEKDWRFVVDKLAKGQKLIKAVYQVVLFSKANEAEKNERYLLSLYKTKGWNLYSEKYLQLHAFLSALPFIISAGMQEDLKKFRRLKTMVTWTAANIAPLIGEWKGMQDPTMMLIGRRGQPLFWNPFSNPSGNYNVAVVGKSGSGKSVFMQELVSSLRGAGGQVIVVDDGRSFMNSCILQGGTFIEFSNENPVSINPFSIVNEQEFNNNPDYKGEVIQLLNLIIRQMCRNEVKTDDYENSIIARAINRITSEKKCKASISDIQEYLENSPEIEAKRLSEMIKPFAVGGSYSRYFEGEANIALTSLLYVFEFDQIKSKPELQRIVLMVLIFLVTEKMFHGDRKRTTSLVIDEAWSLLHGNAFAEFTSGCQYFSSSVTPAAQVSICLPPAVLNSKLLARDGLLFISDQISFELINSSNVNR